MGSVSDYDTIGPISRRTDIEPGSINTGARASSVPGSGPSPHAVPKRKPGKFPLQKSDRLGRRAPSWAFASVNDLLPTTRIRYAHVPVAFTFVGGYIVY